MPDQATPDQSVPRENVDARQEVEKDAFMEGVDAGELFEQVVNEGREQDSNVYQVFSAQQLQQGNHGGDFYYGYPSRSASNADTHASMQACLANAASVLQDDVPDVGNCSRRKGNYQKGATKRKQKGKAKCDDKNMELLTQPLPAVHVPMNGSRKNPQVRMKKTKNASSNVGVAEQFNNASVSSNNMSCQALGDTQPMDLNGEANNDDADNTQQDKILDNTSTTDGSENSQASSEEDTEDEYVSDAQVKHVLNMKEAACFLENKEYGNKINRVCHLIDPALKIPKTIVSDPKAELKKLAEHEQKNPSFTTLKNAYKSAVQTHTLLPAENSNEHGGIKYSEKDIYEQEAQSEDYAYFATMSMCDPTYVPSHIMQRKIGGNETTPTLARNHQILMNGTVMGKKTTRCHADNLRPFASDTCAVTLQKYEWQRPKVPPKEPKEKAKKDTLPKCLEELSCAKRPNLMPDAVEAFESYKYRRQQKHYEQPFLGKGKQKEQQNKILERFQSGNVSANEHRKGMRAIDWDDEDLIVATAFESLDELMERVPDFKEHLIRRNNSKNQCLLEKVSKGKSKPMCNVECRFCKNRGNCSDAKRATNQNRSDNKQNNQEVGENQKQPVKTGAERSNRRSVKRNERRESSCSSPSQSPKRTKRQTGTKKDLVQGDNSHQANFTDPQPEEDLDFNDSSSEKGSNLDKQFELNGKTNKPLSLQCSEILASAMIQELLELDKASMEITAYLCYMMANSLHIHGRRWVQNNFNEAEIMFEILEGWSTKLKFSSCWLVNFDEEKHPLKQELFHLAMSCMEGVAPGKSTTVPESLRPENGFDGTKNLRIDEDCVVSVNLANNNSNTARHVFN